MSPTAPRRLYLPARDRSYWTAGESSDLPLLYLAWGARDFHREPVPTSRHEGWVCVLIEEGCPTMLVGRRSVSMPAGTLAVIGPDCPFGWRSAARGLARFRLWMWRSLTAAAANPALGSSYETRRLAPRDRPPYLLLHDLCRREVLRAARPAAAYLEGCRILFDATLRRERPDSGESAAASDPLTQARAWIDAHLDSREPVARLCDYLNVSQPTLYRMFAAREGLSPLAYVRRVRLQRARALLEAEGSPSVKEVAFSLGYEHAHDFSRAYRRWFGEPPTAARRGRSRMERAQRFGGPR
jgi:AraC-like DNA-binding protein